MEFQVTWSDLADILLVTVLIYTLLILLRGTRAMQMLWGLLVLVGVYLAAAGTGLITLTSILGHTLAVLPIAIIVLFQQEIRRMLTAFGSTGWLHLGQPSGEDPVLLNELAIAAQALASRRIGVLIAIERTDSLASWAETGILLEARFSYDLLLNIFIPGTPLHDGAVIIRGNRILAASCFLPLTTGHNLSSEPGTRHRAAVGLPEETDALVIVVSEETGTISLAVEQQLMRPLDETTLRTRSSSSCTSSRRQRRTQREPAPTAPRVLSRRLGRRVAAVVRGCRQEAGEHLRTQHQGEPHPGQHAARSAAHIRGPRDGLTSPSWTTFRELRDRATTLEVFARSRRCQTRSAFLSGRSSRRSACRPRSRSSRSNRPRSRSSSSGCSCEPCSSSHRSRACPRPASGSPDGRQPDPPHGPGAGESSWHRSKTSRRRRFRSKAPPIASSPASNHVFRIPPCGS